MLLGFPRFFRRAFLASVPSVMHFLMRFVIWMHLSLARSRLVLTPYSSRSPWFRLSRSRVRTLSYSFLVPRFSFLSSVCSCVCVSLSQLAVLTPSFLLSLLPAPPLSTTVTGSAARRHGQDCAGPTRLYATECHASLIAPAIARPGHATASPPRICSVSPPRAVGAALDCAVQCR